MWMEGGHCPPFLLLTAFSVPKLRLGYRAQIEVYRLFNIGQDLFEGIPLRLATLQFRAISIISESILFNYGCYFKFHRDFLASLGG